MTQADVQLQDIEEVEDEKEFGENKVVMHLHIRTEMRHHTQSNAHPNWRRLKRAKLE